MESIMRYASLLLVASAALLLSCSDRSSPTAPAPLSQSGQAVVLSLGRWSGEQAGSACMTVAQSETSVIAGCWRGSFATPSLRSDGTFDAEGTFRFEAGPSNDTPAPAAHFSGALNGTTLTLTVRQTTGQQTSFALTFAGEGTCSALCV
jgi:hypothetical protein